MKVLVTGATGFLGRAIVDELLQNGLEVFTTAKSSRADLPNYFPADITDAETLNELEKLEKIDAIIHAAGLAHQFEETSREKFWRVNVEGARNVANLARKLKIEKFILISSVAVYGDAVAARRPPKFEEDSDCRPLGFYAESKLEAEKTVTEICENASIDLTILRPSTIVGEGDRGNVARLIKAIDRRRFLWIGKGKNLKSLIYKADVARACSHFIENFRQSKTIKANIYNVTAKPVSMREIVGEIEKVLQKSAFPVYFPASPAQKSFRLLGKASGVKRFSKIAETIDKWLQDDVFSGEKIKTEMGFETTVSPIDGIRREALSYRKQK